MQFNNNNNNDNDNGNDSDNNDNNDDDDRLYGDVRIFHCIHVGCT